MWRIVLLGLISILPAIPGAQRDAGAADEGHVRYHGVPNNGACIGLFRQAAGWLWRRALQRRSQKHRLPWRRMRRYIDRCAGPLPFSQYAMNSESAPATTQTVQL